MKKFSQEPIVARPTEDTKTKKISDKNGTIVSYYFKTDVRELTIPENGGQTFYDLITSV